MKCPVCKGENRETAKFCKHCGSNLERVCYNCNAPLPSDSQFCDECGAHLESPKGKVATGKPFEDKITQIQKYLPKGLTEKILRENGIIIVSFCPAERDEGVVGFDSKKLIATSPNEQAVPAWTLRA